MCALRSEEWLRSFDLEGEAFATNEAYRLHLTNAEIDAAEHEHTRIYSATMAVTSCKSLVNSATMDHLDEVQRKLTGGYH